MKSFKLVAALVLVVVFVLGGLTLAMAAVTAPLQFPEATAQLTVRDGEVQVQKSGSTAWVNVDESAQVEQGDSIKTGPAADASINLYDQGVLHLAENSTLTLDETVWDPAEPDVFQGQIFLEAGNVWSRLFDFVSPESDFEVRTSSTVATVRGTTFWVGALPGDTSRVYVDNHTVEVRSLVSAGVLDVTDGEMVRLDRPGQRVALRFVAPPSGQDLEVIGKYRRWDNEYEQDLQARQLAFARGVRKIDPQSSLYNFQRFSERIRLAVAGNDAKRNALRERFMAGRVLDAYVEYAEHHDLTRTKILLAHAQQFGGGAIAARPNVRRALLYFGRLRADSPDSLSQILEEEAAQPSVEPQTDTDSKANPEATPSSYQPRPPVVAGQTTEVSSQPTQPVADGSTDPAPSSSATFDTTVGEPVIYQAPDKTWDYQPVR